jgi:hypothetical protein
MNLEFVHHQIETFARDLLLKLETIESDHVLFL